MQKSSSTDRVNEIIRKSESSMDNLVTIKAVCEPKKFKIVIVGDSGVGKTSFINKYIGKSFTKTHVPTNGANINMISIETSLGAVELDVWDTAGHDKFIYARQGYYDMADAVIIMFDISDKISYANSIRYYNDILNISPNVIAVICGNKVDLSNRSLRSSDITLHEIIGCQYYDISIKSNYNYDKIFAYLVQKLLNNESIEVI